MDLTTIKRQIEAGSIASTRDFEHAIELMFTNALMYNRAHHFVCVILLTEGYGVLQPLPTFCRLQARSNPANAPGHARDNNGECCLRFFLLATRGG